MLTNGYTYHLKLLPPWYLEYEVLIVGETTPENIPNFGPFDIKGEFFDKFNIGLKTYTNLIRETTPIYICRIIESRNPITIKEKATLFIPSTLVDESSSIELLQSVDVSFTVEGISRYFPGVISEAQFLNNAESEIHTALLSVDSLKGDNVAISSSVVEALYEKPMIDAQQAEREQLQANAREILHFQAVENETRITNLVKKSQELDMAKKETASLKAVLENRILQLNAQTSDVESQRLHLEKIKDIMVALITNIQVGSYNPQNFPDFDELYQLASDQLGY